MRSNAKAVSFAEETYSYSPYEIDCHPILCCFVLVLNSGFYSRYLKQQHVAVRADSAMLPGDVTPSWVHGYAAWCLTRNSIESGNGAPKSHANYADGQFCHQILQADFVEVVRWC